MGIETEEGQFIAVKNMYHRKKYWVILLLVLFGIILYEQICLGSQLEYSGLQWYLSDDETNPVNIHVKDMWKDYNEIKLRRKVIIAVIDGGIEIDHPAISSSIWLNENEIPNNGIDDDANGYVDDVHGWNFIHNNGDVQCYDEDKYELQHGTRIAGIICADSKKAEVTGVAADAWIKIMPISIIKNDAKGLLPAGNTDDLIRAIQYAECMGADICNISLNTDSSSELLEKTIKESSMLFVVSAGNRQGRKRNIEKYPAYPAPYQSDNLIAVANIKRNGRLAANSNYGKQSIDIAAPGVDIYGLDVEEGYSYGSGTSFSTPVVSGVAALLYASDEQMDALTCKSLILESAEKFPELKDEIHNGNVLNCQKILQRSRKK